jgi:hypothetical protein
MKMYRLRSVNPKHDLFVMTENEHQMAHFVMDYAMKNGIGRMFGWKEDVLKDVDLEELPEGAYIITEYEPGEVVEATSPSPMTPTKEEQLAAYANYLIDSYLSTNK